MMICIALIVFLLSQSSFLLAQATEKRNVITKTTIQDPALQQQLDAFAKEKTKTSSLFRSGKGYLTLYTSTSSRTVPKHVRRMYYLNVNFVDFDEDSGTVLPVAYTYTSNHRLVLIFNREKTSNAFTKESKANFRQVVEPFLAPLITMPALSDSTQIIQARVESYVQLHGGRYVFLNKDGTAHWILSRDYKACLRK